MLNSEQVEPLLRSFSRRQLWLSLGCKAIAHGNLYLSVEYFHEENPARVTMNEIELVLGLGTNVGSHLLEKSGLDAEKRAEAEHAFMHLGIYMSSLCLHSYSPSKNGAAPFALDLLHQWYEKEFSGDAQEIVKDLAQMAMDIFQKALPVWPHPRDEESAGVRLTAALKELLDDFCGVELTTFEEMRLRSNVQLNFQILAKAHTSFLLEESRKVEGETLKQSKKTALNFLRHPLGTIAAIAFFAGFFVSPYLYPKIFGFSSAEECALGVSTRHQAQMCFSLYPSIDDEKK